MSGATIVQLERHRLSEAATVAERAFGPSFGEAARVDFELSFLDTIRKPTTLVAILDDKVVGTVQCIDAYVNFRTSGIAWVAVDPDYMRMGIGRMLTLHAEAYAQQHYWGGASGSIILVDGSKVEGYYKALGYESGPVLHNDARMMVKNLPEM